MFPKKKYEIETSYTKTEIISKIKGIVGSPYEESEFGGRVGDDSFKIYKKLSPFVHNASNPVIWGEIEDKRVKLSIRLDAFVIIFYSFILLVLFGCLISGVILLFAKDFQTGLPLTLGCIALIALELLISHIPFHISAKKSIKHIESILK